MTRGQTQSDSARRANSKGQTSEQRAQTGEGVGLCLRRTELPAGKLGRSGERWRRQHEGTSGHRAGRLWRSPVRSFTFRVFQYDENKRREESRREQLVGGGVGRKAATSHQTVTLETGERCGAAWRKAGQGPQPHAQPAHGPWGRGACSIPAAPRDWEEQGSTLGAGQSCPPAPLCPPAPAGALGLAPGRPGRSGIFPGADFGHSGRLAGLEVMHGNFHTQTRVCKCSARGEPTVSNGLGGRVGGDALTAETPWPENGGASQPSPLRLAQNNQEPAGRAGEAGRGAGTGPV